MTEWKTEALKDKMKKFMKKDNLIILILTGVLLLIIAIPDNGRKKQDTQEGYSGKELSAVRDTMTLSEENMTEDENVYADEYCRALEKRLEEILSKVDGVGEVKVMVTMASTEEVIIEKEQGFSQSETDETDSNGGVRKVRQTQESEETVRTRSGTGEAPFVRKTLYPVPEGVLVVGEGCGNGKIDKKITEMVQALTGLEAHKIIVAKMK